MGKITRARPDRCAHTTKVSVMFAGLERIVCENCGTVRIASHSELAGEVARDRFARPADQSAAVESELEGFVSH